MPPPDATPEPTAQPLPGAQPPPAPPAAKANPQLKVGSATLKRKARTFAVAGTIAGAVTGKVRVVLTYRVGKAKRTKSLTLSVKNGKFSGTVKLAAGDARKASKPAVNASYAGDSRYTAGTSKGRIKIRP